MTWAVISHQLFWEFQTQTLHFNYFPAVTRFPKSHIFIGVTSKF